MKGVDREGEDEEAMEREDKSDVRSSPVPFVAMVVFSVDSESPRGLLAVSSSSNLATAAATPSKTARSLSGLSKMCDELAWRMYLCCKHAG